jgi:ATP-binding cassette, subfamily B, bacterial
LTMVWLLAGVSWWLPALVALAALPLAWLRGRHAALRVAWQERYVTAQRDVGYAGAVLTGRATAKDVRVFGLAGFWSARLAHLRAQLRQSLRALAGKRSRDELLVHTISSAGLFAAYFWLANQALAGGLSLGGLVLQAQAAQRAQNGVRDLLAAMLGVHEHRLFLRPVLDFLALRPGLVAAPPPATPPPGALALAVRQLAFRYPEAACQALHDVSFDVAAGERLAIVGPNGSGKSTLLKLLARLYAPAAGSLAANGVALQHVEPAGFRARLSVLLQDAALFELSVRDNLGLGRTAAAPPCSDAELWQALAVVGLVDRVRALPAGLDTMCSRRFPGGADWSAGEARRLVLARALLRPADLLLLDEPFLALDGVLATALEQHLAQRSRRTTVIVVDHRPQAIRWVDRVLVLERGTVTASGAPRDLAQHHARFRELFPG